MKNITVSVPDDVYYAARVKAAEHRTTISAIVRERLQSFAQQAEATDAGKYLLEVMDCVRRERAGQPPFRASDILTREELYDEAIRGHKSSDL